jgi:MOSC domain-containing protein YiiM
MQAGHVVSIAIAESPSAPMKSLEEVQALSGVGLEGDRYAGRSEGCPITLISADAIDAMKLETGYDLAYADARRNIVTRGVPLNEYVDKEFTVGSVRLRGLRLSEPCEHLAGLTDERVLRGLAHRAGIKAEVLSSGVIRVGDAVAETAAAPGNAMPAQAQ